MERLVGVPNLLSMKIDTSALRPLTLRLLSVISDPTFFMAFFLLLLNNTICKVGASLGCKWFFAGCISGTSAQNCLLAEKTLCTDCSGPPFH